MKPFGKLSLGLAFLLQACRACLNGGTPVEGEPFTCICTEQFEGFNCLFRRCGPNGINFGSDECKCDPAWRGPNCNIPKCKNGYSVQNTCLCVSGYTGTFCDQLESGTYCKNGIYDTFTRKCLCTPNWTGDFCDEISCDNGQAVNKTFCACFNGFKGQSCELPDRKSKELILSFLVLLVLFGFVCCCWGCLRAMICKRTLRQGVVLQTAQNSVPRSYATIQHQTWDRPPSYEQAVSAR